MRNMSFSMTTEAIRQQTKTVTRRFGWWFLKPGDLVQPVEKGMGLRKGEHVKPIGPPIRVKSTRGEPLKYITSGDVVLEGFPDHMPPREFIRMLCRHYGCSPEERVNRIEFEYTAPTYLEYERYDKWGNIRLKNPVTKTGVAIGDRVAKSPGNSGLPVRNVGTVLAKSKGVHGLMVRVKWDIGFVGEVNGDYLQRV